MRVDIAAIVIGLIACAVGLFGLAIGFADLSIGVLAFLTPFVLIGIGAVALVVAFRRG
jgi:hypothetical protein